MFDTSPRAITGSDSTAATDHDRVIQVSTASVVVTLADAATMTAGHKVDIHNSSAGNITITRATAADTINGVQGNYTLGARQHLKLRVNAAANGYLVEGSIPQLMPMYMQGLTYSNNAGDATNDIDIAVGSARDATDAIDMVLTSALTKRSDATFVVGTGQGGLDTGAVGNSDYYIWLIKRSDTGVVDAIFSLSNTAPTMPASYDYKRLIGWIKRVGGTIVAFHTYETEGGGLEMNWDSPTLDVDLAATLTTTRRTDAVKVPLNFSVEAHLNVQFLDAVVSIAWVYCPDQTDLAPSATAAPLFNEVNQVAGVGSGGQLRVRTSATGTIAARAGTATIDNYRVATMGFRWARRN